MYPFVPRNLHEGQFCKEMIIEGFQLKQESFNLDLWGKGDSLLYIYSDLEIIPNQGECKKKGGFFELRLPFSDDWERKSINCKFLKKQQ